MQDDHNRIVRRGAACAAAAVLTACLALAVARADETPAPAPATPAAPAAGAAATPSAASDDPVVAQRGDIKLTASQVREMIRFAEPETRHVLESNPQALMQAVRDRMIKLTLLREAEARQWDKRDDIAYRAELAREEAIESSWIASEVAGDPGFPTEDQVKTAYEANKAKITVPKQYPSRKSSSPCRPAPASRPRRTRSTSWSTCASRSSSSTPTSPCWPSATPTRRPPP